MRIIFMFMVFNIAFSQCDELLESECYSDNSCEWIVDIDTGWCGTYNNNSSECLSIDDCNWSTCQIACTGGAPSDCTQSGCSYSWLEYTCTGYYSAPCCSGGAYQQDNSFCEEMDEIVCEEMDEILCVRTDNCNWIEDINSGYCGNLNTFSACTEYSACSWSCMGFWYLGSCYGGYGCGGGYYSENNSYCEELAFILGDANGDGSLNVSDIVMMVEFILNVEYDIYADINQDSILNVLDVIELLNTILNN